MPSDIPWGLHISDIAKPQPGATASGAMRYEGGVTEGRYWARRPTGADDGGVSIIVNELDASVGTARVGLFLRSGDPMMTTIGGVPGVPSDQWGAWVRSDGLIGVRGWVQSDPWSGSGSEVTDTIVLPATPFELRVDMVGPQVQMLLDGTPVLDQLFSAWGQRLLHDRQYAGWTFSVVGAGADGVVEVDNWRSYPADYELIDNRTFEPTPLARPWGHDSSLVWAGAQSLFGGGG